MLLDETCGVQTAFKKDAERLLWPLLDYGFNGNTQER